jgi:hypothetical protein
MADEAWSNPKFLIAETNDAEFNDSCDADDSMAGADDSVLGRKSSI